MLNNPNLDLVNIKTYAKKDFSISLINSQDTELKQNSDMSQGPKLC